jgi:hypothetical protein
MRNLRITDAKLKEMRNFLPQGSTKLIAIKTGLTPIYVSKVLHGVHLNLNVINEAIKIALEEKNETDELNQTLENSFNNNGNVRK